MIPKTKIKKKFQYKSQVDFRLVGIANIAENRNGNLATLIKKAEDIKGKTNRKKKQ